jgi:transcriptional regulator with XRE-family HTH domain
MDVSSVIRVRLEELKLEQKDLAGATNVTESYISQLMTRKKLPPAPDRTDIYEKLEKILKLPNRKLAKLALAQRLEALQRRHEEPRGGLLKETRKLILSKCDAARQNDVRSIFERQPFGELEQIVTRKLLDVISQVVRSQLDNQAWLDELAQLGDKNHEEMRLIVQDFLGTDIFNISKQDCDSLLAPLLARWDIDLSTFNMEITLNERLAPGEPKKFAFIERDYGNEYRDEPGLNEFLRDAVLSSDLSKEEHDFLKSLRFGTRRPNRLFYYRALQNLRDPLLFLAVEEFRFAQE